MQKALELLVSLGLPSATIAMVLIALLFKRDHSKIAAWAGWAAVGLVAVIGIGQLVQIWRGDVTIEMSPNDAVALDNSGRPVELEITVRRAGRILETITLKTIADDRYETRSLAVTGNEDRLSVLYENQPIGVLRRERLTDVGWRPAAECGSPGAGDPRFWSTHRVFVGREHNLGTTRYGILRLQAKRFTQDGKAVVALSLEGHDAPIPKDVPIANKGLGIQSFANVPDFYIAVREADFTVDPPWAAFSVFSIQ